MQDFDPANCANWPRAITNAPGTSPAWPICSLRSPMKWKHTLAVASRKSV